MATIANSYRSWRLLASSLAIFQAIAGRSADSKPASSLPPYKSARFDEDYRYLRDPEQKGDFLDTVKYMPLDKSGSWYVSLGGEAREKYEYYENYNWGLGPQDPDAIFSSATSFRLICIIGIRFASSASS